LFLSGFLTKTLYAFFLSPACVTCPTCLILLNFDHPNRLWQGVHMELNFMRLYLDSCCFLPIKPQYLLSILFSTPSVHAPHWVWHTKFHTHKKIIYIYLLNIRYFEWCCSQIKYIQTRAMFGYPRTELWENIKFKYRIWHGKKLRQWTA
jgi:hypothetical protein